MRRYYRTFKGKSRLEVSLKLYAMEDYAKRIMQAHTEIMPLCMSLETLELSGVIRIFTDDDPAPMTAIAEEIEVKTAQYLAMKASEK